MSRTRKDEPRFVKLEKHGKIKHYAHCGRNNRLHTLSCSVIFFAHEVREMEAFESKISELNGKLTKVQKDGYLATLWSFKDGDSFWGLSQEMRANYHNISHNLSDVANPKRVSVEATSQKPNLAGRMFASGPLFVDVNMSKRNIFYVYEVSLPNTSNVKHTGPSRAGTMDDVCCYAELPKSVEGKRGCSCCDPAEDDKVVSKTAVRDSLRTVTKSFNSGSLSIYDSVDAEGLTNPSRI